ncbi:MAG: hypothetical protein UDL61_11425, partial [Ruminococcus callidus]|nr:hypothetical protein [Ruminococcus callidus]
CTPSACKFPVIFHKNAREYIQYSLRFLFHLTKNLTTHLSHNLCAVLTCHILSTCRKQMILFHERILKISGFLQKLLDMTGEFGYNKSVGEFCKKFPKKSMQ